MTRVTAYPHGAVVVDGQPMPRGRERFFVTPHAVRRYRERVDHRASFEAAVRAIEAGLQGRGPSPIVERPVAIADRRERFVAIVAPARPEYGPHPAVLTIWRYGVCPILLKRKGGRRHGIRKYRWLKGPVPARPAARPTPESTRGGGV